MIAQFDRESFRKRLAQAYYHSGLTNVEVQRMTGISRKNLQAYSRGEYLPGIESLTKMCEAFGVNAHWLLTGEGRAPEWI